MQIDKPGSYQMRNGERVEVFHNNESLRYCWHDKSTHRTWDRSGLVLADHCETEYDLIAPWPADADVNIPADATPAEMLQEMKIKEDRFDRYRPQAAPGYEPLFVTLLEAHDQAAHGKGRDRHANGKPFLDQPIMEIGRMVGVGYQTGQAMKKSQEAIGMLKRNEPTKAQAELLGAMNYLAAAYILIEEQMDADIAAKHTITPATGA